MTAPISNGPTTHGYTTMRDATQKEPGTLLFLPCFSQDTGATLRFQPGHVIDTERPALPRSPAARLASLPCLQRGQPGVHDGSPGPLSTEKESA